MLNFTDELICKEVQSKIVLPSATESRIETAYEASPHRQRAAGTCVRPVTREFESGEGCVAAVAMKELSASQAAYSIADEAALTR